MRALIVWWRRAPRRPDSRSFFLRGPYAVDVEVDVEVDVDVVGVAEGAVLATTPLVCWPGVADRLA